MESTIERLYKTYLKYPQVTTDSRKIPKDSIFFALKGEHFNGNEFALEALNKGANLAVVDELVPDSDDRIVYVNNVLETLQALAHYHRNQLSIKVIGITGTNGKTTTKELIQCVLTRKYKSFATHGNLNNHIGVPLTILSLTKAHDFAVVEMGANHIGEIAQLCDIASPDYGIITNIGKAHLDGFGGLDGVIKAKTELYSFIRKLAGKIFVNKDNELLIKNANGIDPITYGENEAVDCKGELIGDFPFLELKCTMEGKSVQVKSQLVGRYNFENILAAVCIGNYFNVAPSDIQEAIESYQPTNNRSQIVKTFSNTIILDAYNANPSSMKAALENFALGNFKNKVLILGDMAELGVESHAEHILILELIKSRALNNVILIGPEFEKANQSFGFSALKDKDQLEDFLKEMNFQNATILIKGSRNMQLEQITPML
ncbi:MAG: UDP-N-acetylmuramoyl-tripeptide--D-alanyl-D-alanine ligase [Bacteroidales bacterium]|nr:UDP-N-acetylmuramoyl-tripeptide--D-alanyl-D-alanine ligase [Bacteroidales bacterium]